MRIAIDKFKVEKYSSYKDSGVQWLREIPEHWEVRKGKWLFIKQERPAKKEDGIITCFRDGQVTLRTNRKTEGFTIALKEHGYQGIRKGDLVIHNMDAFAGAIGISDSDGKSTPVYSACTPRIANRVNPYYYAYFLKDLAKSGFIESLAKGIRERSTDFRFNDFGLLLLSVPPLPEQIAIAEFLDHKTALIDQAIGIKQKQIELLKERRQILIHKAVTRGLNPNVKMKDSGLEWIGEIPEHWGILRLKELCKAYGRIGFRGYTTADLVSEGEGAITISPSNIKEGFMTFDKCSFLSWKKYNESPEIQIFENDVLIVKTGSTGKTGIVKNLPQNATINPQLLVLKEIKINPDYFYTLLKTSMVQYQVQTEVIGSTIPTISENKILNFKVAIPDSIEIQQIESYNRNVNMKYSKALSLKEQEIEKLKEYRATLINSAVTGKIKVYNDAK
jgi:type I restriction enzyme, S subunit